MYKILFSLLCATVMTAGAARIALANCSPLNVTAWTADQRQFLSSTIETALSEEVQVSWIIVEELVKVCARVADTSGLDSASLQTQAQTLFAAYQVAKDAKDAEETDIITELDTSPLCRTATLAQLNVRIDAEYDTQLAAIQAAIDGTALNLASVKSTMTTMNNRLIGTGRQTTKQLAKCIVGYLRLQQQQQQQQ